ncbi:MAG: hypothetical protein ACW98I_02775 [Candidatus Hodarchaeales archaeon]|jgi:hypothetical protein
MSIDEGIIESDSLFKYIFNFGISHVKKTVRSSFRVLGVEDLADEFFENNST